MARWYDRQGNEIDVSSASKLLNDISYKRIAYDEIDHVRVSTVWLGLDHRFGGDGPPLIFETMVFPKKNGNWLDDYRDVDCQRYATEAEALAGHKEMVEKWIGKMPKKDE